MLGSFAAEPLGRRIPEVRLLLGCWTLDALLMLVPVLVPTVPAIAVSLFLLGFPNTNGNVISQSMRQRMVAPGMLGRVGGASRTLGYGLMPVGALLGGLVAERWGLPAVFIGATVVCVAAVAYPIAVVRQRMVTELELPAPVPPRSVYAPGHAPLSTAARLAGPRNVSVTRRQPLARSRLLRSRLTARRRATWNASWSRRTR